MLIFKNPGEIDMVAATVGGVSVKEHDSPIGQFGTGLKYAVAVILRLGGSVEIHSGTERHVFGVDEYDIRGKTFGIVTMNGQRLGFTTEYGKSWKPWMVYRELWSNTHDENGSIEVAEKIPEPTAGETHIVVDLPDLETLHHTEGTEIVIPESEEPLETVEDVGIYRGPSSRVYYRGIRVSDVPGKTPDSQSMFKYNLLGYQTLTEDRTLAYTWMVPVRVARALAASKDPETIERVLTAADAWFEGTLPWDDLSADELGETFLDVLMRLHDEGRLRGAAQRLFGRQRDQLMAMREPSVAKLTVAEKALLRRAVGAVNDSLREIIGGEAEYLSGGDVVVMEYLHGSHHITVRRDDDGKRILLSAGALADLEPDELQAQLLMGWALFHVRRGSPARVLAHLILHSTLPEEEFEDATHVTFEEDE